METPTERAVSERTKRRLSRTEMTLLGGFAAVYLGFCGFLVYRTMHFVKENNRAIRAVAHADANLEPYGLRSDEVLPLTYDTRSYPKPVDPDGNGRYHFNLMWRNPDGTYAELEPRFAWSYDEQGFMTVFTAFPNLEPDAATPTSIPESLKSKLTFADRNKNGSLESYLLWDDASGGKTLLPIKNIEDASKDTKGTLYFPTLDDRQVTPLDFERFRNVGFQADYLRNQPIQYPPSTSSLDELGQIVDMNARNLEAIGPILIDEVTDAFGGYTSGLKLEYKETPRGHESVVIAKGGSTVSNDLFKQMLF